MIYCSSLTRLRSAKVSPDGLPRCANTSEADIFRTPHSENMHLEFSFTVHGRALFSQPRMCKR